MTCTTVYHCRHARFILFITPMKKIFFILLFSSQAVLAQFVDANLKASGLTCSMCNLATQRQLQQLTFIDSIVPDLDLNLFHIYFNQQQEVNIDLIKKSVEDAGFSVAELLVSFKKNETFIYNNPLLFIGKSVFVVKGFDPQKDKQVFKIIDEGFVTVKENKKFIKVRKEMLLLDNINSNNLPITSKIYHVLTQ